MVNTPSNRSIEMVDLPTQGNQRDNHSLDDIEANIESNEDLIDND